ncbi:MAG: LmbE family protein [Chloroflexi bacterium]|nr:MAG: LmbE family protein [Chloroflexota bacterium]
MATQPTNRWTALAIGAHPDDIEFGMAGTLLRLQAAGAEIHMWNLADGACGTREMPRDEIVRIRGEEAAAAARVAGAVLHPPIATDLEIFYTREMVAKVAAVIRTVQPTVLLIPALQDYMEDHMNTARLAVTGAFARGMRNFETLPVVPPWEGEVAVYHAMPHGGCDSYGRPVLAQRFVDITPVMQRKTEMLAQHASQRGWLRDSQAIDSYLQAMTDSGTALGMLSGKYRYAEGWRPHNYLGFANLPTFDPMKDVLGKACSENLDRE